MSSTTTINIAVDNAYIGVLQAIGEPAQPAEILDNLEEAQDNVDIIHEEDQINTKATMDVTELLKSIKEVSKGVSEKTAQEYER
jgi:hypothetical protein